MITWPDLFTDKEDLTVNPNADINKITASDLNGLKQALQYFYEFGGYESYTDDTAVSLATAQTFTAGTDGIMTINTSEPNTSQSPIEAENPLWDGTKIIPVKQGDSILVRLDFKAQIASNDGYFTMKVDISGNQSFIIQKVNSFPKGANNEHSFSFTNWMFQGATFTANGGILKLNPSHEMKVWDKTISIQRIYKGR